MTKSFVGSPSTSGLAALFAVLISQPIQADTPKTYGPWLFDACKEQVVVRGVNAGIAFPSDPTAASLSEISQTGANAVRLTFRWLYNRSDPQSVRTALQKSTENHMLAIPSLWDATGDWSKLPFAVDFWTRPEMVAVLREYEDMLLLNIANEAGDGSVTQEDFRQGYAQAIRSMRQAGLHMPLVIDAAGVGRDENTILDNAQFLIASDPDRNLLFSWHPWDQDQPRLRYETFLKSVLAKKIPVLLGEVSSVGALYQGEIDYRAILQMASEAKVGWLWWWWHSGGRADAHSLTLDGKFGNWANVGEEVVMTSPYGIDASAKRTIYLNTRSCGLRVAKPTAPSNLTAVATTGAEVQLSWKDRSYNEKNFDIEVWDNGSARWKFVKAVASNTVSANIGAAGEFVYSMNSAQGLGLNYSTTYQFRVGAYVDKNNIAYSSPVSVTTKPNPSVCSSGDGLLGEYFLPAGANGAWNDLARVDPQINFNWGSGSLDPADPTAPSDNFDVIWQGEIEPQFDDEYTFYTESDDFARVWIDGTLVVDNWQGFANGWAVGKIQLQAGVKYAISVEYKEFTGDAKMSLHWASSKLKRELVPQCRLFAPRM